MNVDDMLVLLFESPRITVFMTVVYHEIMIKCKNQLNQEKKYIKLQTCSNKLVG